MRSIKKSSLFVLTLAGLSVFAPTETEAQTFPTSAWLPLTRAQANIIAPANATVGDQSDDIVGTNANPAAYVYTDATYIYFRIRVDANPSNGGNTAIRNDRVFGCAIDTDPAQDASYEFIALYDGITNMVTLRQHTGAATSSPGDIAATAVSAVVPGGTYPNGVAGRVVATGSTLNTDPDYFVDIAVARAGLRVSVPDTRTLRFACGTGSANGLNVDVFDPGGNFPGLWSDPYVCGNDGCLIDRDSDGVPDATEALRTTSPTLKDTDGDGINDNVELSVTGSTGPYSGPDFDNDGVIDAKDTDSDNDCIDDSAEGTGGYRSVSANAFQECAATPMTPACSLSTGNCAACDGPFTGSTPAKCPTTQSPACYADGSCKQCGPGQTQNCMNVLAPACGTAGVTLGTCTSCTGDNGASTNAACPSSVEPACHTSGPLFGQCKKCSRANGSLCTTASLPACNTVTGACSACNGDFGGIETQPCAIEGEPTCRIVNGTVGTCFKCTTNADCLESSKHNGPTCDVPSGKCIDTDSDGDGLNDSIEINLGTDKTKVDTDGDGISDNVEARPNGGGSPAKIDTDGDGIIDALDTDSDNDTLPDSQEGTTDTDLDTAPDFRDPDDDGDQIPTSIEVVDGQVAKVTDDVDMDSKKNWLDKDSDNNGVDDGVEGRGDEDLDGIPDYLDNFKDPPKVDSGASSSGNTSSSSSGGTPVDGGFTSTEEDASVPRFDAGPIEEGVVEGTGLFCGRSAGTSGLADIGVIMLGAAVAIGATRRRRRR